MARGGAGMLVASVLDDMPLFWPAVAVALAAAVGLAGILGRGLRAPTPVAFFLLASLGLVAAATLTPAAGAEPHVGCVIGALAPPPLDQLAYLNETSLNVALFVPLGVACGLLPGAWRAAAACVVAAGVPATVELAQSALPSLGRVCTTDDVMANLTGLTAGIALAVVLVRPWLAPR